MIRTNGKFDYILQHRLSHDRASSGIVQLRSDMRLADVPMEVQDDVDGDLRPSIGIATSVGLAAILWSFIGLIIWVI